MIDDATSAQLQIWALLCSEYLLFDNPMLFKDFLSYWNCFKKKNGKNPGIKMIRNQFLRDYKCMVRSAL